MPYGTSRSSRDARAAEAPGRAPNRAADQAAMGALIDRLLPALAAKLSSTHLGEIEVREGDWRIRLRRPAGSGQWNGELRRAGDKASRTQPGHEAHGHSRGAVEAHRPAAALGPTNGTGHSTEASPAKAEDRTRTMATSPAVGVFQPGPRATAGTRVRSGDGLGVVDVLGVPEEVTAPADGLVGEVLVEGGTAVEYGQELIVIELAAPVGAG